MLIRAVVVTCKLPYGWRMAFKVAHAHGCQLGNGYGQEPLVLLSVGLWYFLMVSHVSSPKSRVALDTIQKSIVDVAMAILITGLGRPMLSVVTNWD